jgi:hypothetical protein
MRRSSRVLVVAVSVFTVLMLTATAAWAGSPHFVSNTVTKVTNADGSLTVSGKEAGLGDEEQVHIVVSATAQCINPGQKHPKAANKEAVEAGADFPVQNGKAEFSLTLVATTISPNCSPPMTIVWTDITVTDTTNGITTDP